MYSHILCLIKFQASTPVSRHKSNKKERKMKLTTSWRNFQNSQLCFGLASFHCDKIKRGKWCKRYFFDFFLSPKNGDLQPLKQIDNRNFLNLHFFSILVHIFILSPYQILIFTKSAQKLGVKLLRKKRDLNFLNYIMQITTFDYTRISSHNPVILDQN